MNPKERQIIATEAGKFRADVLAAQRRAQALASSLPPKDLFKIRACLELALRTLNRPIDEQLTASYGRREVRCA